VSNRKDRERRERRARERLARGKPPPEPSPPEPPAPEPERPTPKGVFPNPATQFPPGQTGNPAGYSHRGRLNRAVNRLLNKPGLEDDVATTVVAMTLGTKLKDRDPKIEWWRELRSLIEGPEPRVFVHKNVDANIEPMTQETNGQMDAATAERVMLAAAPEAVPDLEDEG
jgi:hypothetical protein